MSEYHEKLPDEIPVIDTNEGLGVITLMAGAIAGGPFWLLVGWILF